MERRIDPVTLALIAAIAGITGGTITTVRFLQEKLGTRFPIELYRKLGKLLTQLADEISYLRKDIDILESIFQGAQYVRGDRTVSLENGAFLSVSEFMRYERVSAAALSRLHRINKLTLKIERVASSALTDRAQFPAATASAALEKVTRVLRDGDLKVDEAWRLVRSATDDLLEAISKIRHSLNG